MKSNLQKENFIPMWPALPWAQIFKNAKKSSIFPFSAPQQYYFYFGRAALWHACDFLNLKKGDEVIVPAYSNDLIYEVFDSRNIKTRYIDITADFQINAEKLKKSIKAETKAVLLIHYFGWPQENMPEIIKICQEQGIFLIEDCALAPASFAANRPLGSVGDVSIYSLKKYLPLPNGGLLVINNQKLLGKNKIIETTTVNSWLELASSLLAQLFIFSNLIYRIFGYCIRGLKKIVNKFQPVQTGSAEFSRVHRQLGISKVSLRLLQRFDFVAIGKKRRLNYQRLENWVRNTTGYDHIRQPFQLKAGVSPLAFPLMVAGASQSTARMFRNHGIGAGAWWQQQGKYQTPGDFPVSEYLRNRIITLPIHQSLNYKKIDFIGKIIQRSSEADRLKILNYSLLLPHAVVESSDIR